VEFDGSRDIFDPLLTPSSLLVLSILPSNATCNSDVRPFYICAARTRLSHGLSTRGEGVTRRNALARGRRDKTQRLGCGAQEGGVEEGGRSSGGGADFLFCALGLVCAVGVLLCCMCVCVYVCMCVFVVKMAQGGVCCHSLYCSLSRARSLSLPHTHSLPFSLSLSLFLSRALSLSASFSIYCFFLTLARPLARSAAHPSLPLSITLQLAHKLLSHHR